MVRTRQTLPIFSLLWVVTWVEFVVADGHCSKGKDGSQVCVDHMPVAANVVIAIATLTILGLLITLLICMKRHRGHSQSSAPDFIFDSEQMQGPPTIIETHYNPSSGRVDVLSAKSPSFSASISSLERKSSGHSTSSGLPPRGPSPALPPRGPSPALPPRAKSPLNNHRDGVPASLNHGVGPTAWNSGAGQAWNPAPGPYNPTGQAWNPGMQTRQNRLSLPVSFVTMPGPMTAPPSQATFAFNNGMGAGAGTVEERRLPSYEVESTAFPQPPQTAFVTSHFERPPQHPSLRRTGRYNN